MDTATDYNSTEWQMWILFVCPKDERGRRTPEDGRDEPSEKAKVQKLR